MIALLLIASLSVSETLRKLSFREAYAHILDEMIWLDDESEEDTFQYRLKAIRDMKEIHKLHNEPFETFRERIKEHPSWSNFV
jgi:hypothetical protein